MRFGAIFGREEPETEPIEPVPVRICCRCGGDIWAWEAFGLDEGGLAICTDCAEALWRSLTDPERLALLGLEPRVEKRGAGR